MKPITIVTHNATFHADEVFGVAILMLALEATHTISVVRTRDLNVIQTGDYVLDVGGVYDEKTHRFDHHQEGGAGTRSNGIPYAACGLVWKAYGLQITSHTEVAARVEKEIIEPIDASDNGVDTYTSLISGLEPIVIQQYIGSFNPTWKEGEGDTDVAFMNMVVFAKQFLKRKIQVISDALEGEKKVRDAYDSAPDKRLIILDEDYSWGETISQYPEPLFVVYPNAAKDMWRVKTVRNSNSSYVSRKSLPEAWAGKTGGQLALISGVSDAVFCHNKRFTAAASSKAGAIALAEKALEN